MPENRYSLIEKSCRNSTILQQDEFVECFTEPDGRFLLSEGEYWDFKNSWPFSRSDDYFYGIANHICGFANNGGGYIIFNVDDNTRKHYPSPVKMNSDSLIQGIAAILNQPPDTLNLSFFEYKVGDNMHPTIFIPPRHITVPPLYIQVNKHNRFGSDQIYFRIGHETKIIQERNYRTLFLRDDSDDSNDRQNELITSIPNRPTTIRKFIGRVRSLTALFDWINDPDSSVCYLWGRGGSGKSTIAWNLCRLFAMSGFSPTFKAGLRFDAVCFLSAKRIQMNTLSAQQEAVTDIDFYDRGSLRRAILKAGRYTTDEAAVDELDEESLDKAIKELFAHTNMLIVLDDIDTLTNESVDVGLGKLTNIANRSDGVKILFTQRDEPKHALDSAIEVPGLRDRELVNFCQVCADQFKVPAPSEALINGGIKQHTEGRPLAVEALVALMRKADDYERAIALYKGVAGDNLREYVFKREWDAIPAGRLGRQLLCLIALMKRPVNFSEIQTILERSSEEVSDAIGSVKDMFLITSNSEPVAYELGPLTRDFVLEMLPSTKYADLIKKKVSAFKSQSKHIPQSIIWLAQVVESKIHPDKWHRYIYTESRGDDRPYYEYVEFARREVGRADKAHDQEPSFRGIRAFVYSVGKDTKPQQVWEDVYYIMGLSTRINGRYIAAITNCISEYSHTNIVALFDHMFSCGLYSSLDLFQAKKNLARSYAMEASNVIGDDFPLSYSHAVKALNLNLEAYSFSISSPEFSYESERLSNHCENGLNKLFSQLNNPSHFELYRSLSEIMKDKTIVCDPIHRSLGAALRRLNPAGFTPPTVGKFKQALRQLKDVANNANWENTLASSQLIEDIEVLERRIG